MPFIRWLLIKLLQLFLLLLAVSFASFSLVKLSPIDPVQAYLGAGRMQISPEQLKDIQAYWGSEVPFLEQFRQWFYDVLRGNFGESSIYRQPVIEVISERFLASFLLMLVAWLLSGLLGVVLGSIAAMNENKWLDKWIRTYCYILLATPGFWLGMIILLFFSVYMGWFPIGFEAPIGMTSDEISITDRIYHMILPALTLSLLGIANVCLHTREKLLETRRQLFFIQAQANGTRGWSLVYRHGLRHISFPVISVHFASFSELFGGTILIEQVFSYPGIGEVIVNAGLRGDVALLLGTVIFSACFVFVGNFLADLLHKWIDPRTRREGIQ